MDHLTEMLVHYNQVVTVGTLTTLVRAIWHCYLDSTCVIILNIFLYLFSAICIFLPSVLFGYTSDNLYYNVLDIP